MTTDSEQETCKEFPKVAEFVILSLTRRLPLYKAMPKHFRQNCIKRVRKITHELIRDYTFDNLDQFNGQDSLSKLKKLVARDVDYVFVDAYVAKYIETFLHSPKLLANKKSTF